MKLSNKYLCLVTGASSGIGKAVCETLTKYGAKVVGCGRNEDALKQLKDEESIIDYVVADITKDGECCRVVETAAKILGGLTTIINSAGGLKGGAIGDETTDLANYNYNMKLNTQAPFEIIYHAVPYLKQQVVLPPTESTKERGEEADDNANKNDNPSIVTVSSVNGKQSFASCASYCMSKAAVDQLTRCASIDLAKYGIRVNSVNPGVIKTNLHYSAGMNEEAYESFIKRSTEVTHPISQSLGRVGTPLEVAELIAFLVSDKAKFLTGECIAIDGARQNLGSR